MFDLRIVNPILWILLHDGCKELVSLLLDLMAQIRLHRGDFEIPIPELKSVPPESQARQFWLFLPMPGGPSVAEKCKGCQTEHFGVLCFRVFCSGIPTAGRSMRLSRKASTHFVDSEFHGLKKLVKKLLISDGRELRQSKQHLVAVSSLDRDQMRRKHVKELLAMTSHHFDRSKQTSITQISDPQQLQTFQHPLDWHGVSHS